MARVRAGETGAFAELVHRHARTAKRAAALWGAGADSDDIVQDAFVKAYGALERFRPGADFRPWLLRIVLNETRNLQRSRSRRAAREEAWGWPQQAADPESAVLTATRRDQLLAGVRRLPADLRDTVTCRYLLELSEAETAVALGVPAGTVKSRVHRALERLRKEVPDG